MDIELSEKSTQNKSDNKENTNYLSLEFSPILFVDEEGLGLRFAMKPCLERRTVRLLIEKGGGVMSSNTYSSDSINLVTVNSSFKDKSKSNNKFYFLTFVFDSCKANKLMDLSEYHLKKMTNNDNTSDSEKLNQNNKKDKDNEPSADELPTTVSEPNQLNESNESFLPQIDIKILEFIGQRKAFADINGSRLWIKALNKGIQFGPNWESTKQRFFDYIMPNIDKYSIEEFNKNKFIEYYNRYKEIQTNSDDNISEEELQTNVEDKQITENQTNDKTKETDDSDNSNQLKAHQNEVEKSSKSYVNEREDDLEEESEESTSKYFKINDKFLHRRKSGPKKNYFNAYLDFMKQRETSNTPENLMLIKKALKAGAQLNDQKTDEKCKSNPYLLRNKKDSKIFKNKSFGEKIVSKTRSENSKSENESEESGYKVSDISSDESDGKKNKNNSKQITVNKLNSSSMRKIRISQKHKSCYSLSEDELILEFIVKSKRFDELKGNSLWEEAEKKDICGGRSWQSMKERFRKQIMPNIDTYDITKKEKQRLKSYYYSENMNSSRLQNASSYSYDEDMAIIKNIIKNNGYELVKGNKFWQIMNEELKKKKVCDRSWQSLKERFHKRIVPNLNKYEIRLEITKKILNSSSMSESDKQLLFNKCKKTSIDSKAKKRVLDIRKSKTNNDNNRGSNNETEVEPIIESESQNQKKELSRKRKITNN